MNKEVNEVKISTTCSQTLFDKNAFDNSENNL